MIVVTTRVPVTATLEDEFEQRLFDRLGLLERHAGFLRLEVLRPSPVIVAGVPAGHSDSFVILTYWESPEHFAAWAQSPDFSRAHARRAAGDHFSGSVAYEVHEVIQNSAA